VGVTTLTAWTRRQFGEPRSSRYAVRYANGSRRGPSAERGCGGSRSWHLRFLDQSLRRIQRVGLRGGGGGGRSPGGGGPNRGGGGASRGGGGPVGAPGAK